MSTDKDLLEKVHRLQQVSESSSNRSGARPNINIGNFTSDEEEIEHILDDFVDQQKYEHLELSQECR